MRANRLLGANLVEANLVTIDNLNIANERMLELSASDNPRESTVLGLLANEMKVLSEEAVLQHVVDEHKLGLVDLRVYDMADELVASLDLGACWATWTLPFDREEDVYSVATAYYLSPAVRTFWEKQLNGRIVWFGATLETLAGCFDKMAGERSRRAPAT